MHGRTAAHSERPDSEDGDAVAANLTRLEDVAGVCLLRVGRAEKCKECDFGDGAEMAAVKLRALRLAMPMRFSYQLADRRVRDDELLTRVRGLLEHPPHATSV